MRHTAMTIETYRDMVDDCLHRNAMSCLTNHDGLLKQLVNVFW